TSFVTSLVFSPDGTRLVTGSDDRTALVWDIGNEEQPGKSKPVLTLRGHTYGLTSVAYSPDGETIATASWDRTTCVWDAASGSRRFQLPSQAWVRCVAYSPDGKRLATASWDRTVRLWDAKTGTEQRQLRFDTPIQSLVFSPDSQKLLTLGVDLSARLWDFGAGDDTPQRIQTNGPVRGVAFSPDGELLASVRFDFTGKGLDGALVLPNHQSSVHAVAFRPGAAEQLATGGADNVVLLWKVGTWEVTHTLKGHEGPVRALAYSRDG